MAVVKAGANPSPGGLKAVARQEATNRHAKGHKPSAKMPPIARRKTAFQKTAYNHRQAHLPYSAKQGIGHIKPIARIRQTKASAPFG